MFLTYFLFLLLLSIFRAGHSYFSAASVSYTCLQNKSPLYCTSIVDTILEKNSGIDQEYAIEPISNGIIDYIGRTTPLTPTEERWSSDRMIFRPLTKAQLIKTKWNLWRQLPWKKIKGKTILKIKLKGDMSLEPTRVGGFSNFGASIDLEAVDSLADMSTLLVYAASDPRVVGVLLDIGTFTCGYGKLLHLRRLMDYFRQSGKDIVGYISAGSEKEYFVALGCNEFFIPPDGGLDLRGFSASATFLRGVFDNVGIEPQVQRIGKYKSFGDTFNRTSISPAQREVISSLLTESSDYWLDAVSRTLNKSRSTIVSQLWNTEAVLTPTLLRDMGYITGVRYFDQVEDRMQWKHIQPAATSFFPWFSKQSTNDTTEAVGSEVLDVDFDLQGELSQNPRRSLPSTTPSNNDSAPARLFPKLITVNSTLPSQQELADPSSPRIKSNRSASKALYRELKEEARKKRALARRLPAYTASKIYLRKMRKGQRILQGLPFKESFGGPRIGIINAVGGIGPGRSSNGANGRTLGSDSLISLLRRASEDRDIRAVVLRIDSPGGSALASDLMWRELRRLARRKPVVASMVDVAGSGGYYLGMGCDVIVAEDLTATGSIGVVSAKFNAGELFKRVGAFSAHRYCIVQLSHLLCILCDVTRI